MSSLSGGIRMHQPLLPPILRYNFTHIAMPRLNKTKLNEVFLYLDNQHFTLADFDVEFPDQGDYYVSVTFRHNTKYFFRISEGSTSFSATAVLTSGAERKTKPITHESPGDFKAKQSQSFETFDECIHRISSWCSNLRTELRASSPELQELRQLQEDLERSFQQHIEDPESHFSNEELERVYKSLDSLAERVKQLEEEHSITKAQLNELVAGLEGIRSNAAFLPKGMWAGLTKNRMVSILKKIAMSPEGRKFALEAANKFLLGPKP